MSMMDGEVRMFSRVLNHLLQTRTLNWNKHVLCALESPLESGTSEDYDALQ
jgi:hypothetical protein